MKSILPASLGFCAGIAATLGVIRDGIYTAVFRDGRLRDSNRPPSFLSNWMPHATCHGQSPIHDL